MRPAALAAAFLLLMAGCSAPLRLVSPGGHVRNCPPRGGEECVADALAAGYIEEEDLGAVGLGVAAKAEPGKGLRVTRVVPGSPAGKAGIEVGDHLVRIRGEAPRDRREARMLLFGRAMTRVEVAVRKGGRILVLPVVRAPLDRLKREAD